MRAGDLRHQIEIQRYTEIQNDYGEITQTWNTIHTMRASVNPLSGKEYFASQQINAEVTHKVYIRYVADIKPSDRILFNTRIFNITSIINYQERNITLELMCIEKI